MHQASNGAFIICDGTTPIQPGQWYSTAAVADGQSLSLYLQTTPGGAYNLEKSVPFNGAVGAQNSNWIVGRGFYGGNPTDRFSGLVDEIRISDNALDPSQFYYSAGPTAPAAPTGLTAALGDGYPSGAGSVYLKWNAVAGTTSYTVKRSVTIGGPYSVLYSGVATNAVVNTITIGTRYYYVVMAVNSGGMSPNSNEATTCVMAPSGMVLWLPFDEISGTTAYNAQGGNNGTLVGSPVRGSQYVTRGLSFDGSTQYVNVNSYPAINFGTGDFSIDCWVKRTSANDGSVRNLVEKRRSSGVIQGYSFYLYNGALGFQLADGVGTQYANYGTNVVVPVDGKWHLAAVTVRRNKTTGGQFYLDGVPVSTPFNTALHNGSVSTTLPLRVGSLSESADSLFLGSLDEVEAFSRVLTPAEIATLWQAQSAGKCKEICAMTWDSYFKATNPNVAGVPATICNKSGVAQTYTYQFQGLPKQNGYTDPGPTGFSPGSGTVTVPANSCITVATIMSRPAWFNNHHNSGLFQVVFTNTQTGHQVSCMGAARDIRPAPMMAPQSQSSLLAIDANSVLLSGMTLFNQSAQTVTRTLTVTVMNQDMTFDTQNVALNGLAPGTPLTFSVTLTPAQTILIPPMFARFVNYDPGNYYTLLVDADVYDDGNPQPVFTALLSNAVSATDTAIVTGSIALEGVGNLSTTDPNAPLGVFEARFGPPRNPPPINDLKNITLNTTPGSPYGTFTLTGIVPGTFDIWIKGSKNLAVVVPGVVVAAGTAVPSVTLPAGDANDDNQVDPTDFATFVGAYNTDSSVPGGGYDPTADFNFDGVVDPTDFGLFVGDYNSAGAP